MNELELIAQNIRAERKRIGLRQNEAAKRAGITPHMWRFVEQRTRTPSLKNLLKMCEVLNIKLIDLLKEDRYERV
jgi:transcriptional regulator with XRE-family HTH domain